MPRYGGDFARGFLLDTITHHQIAAEVLGICVQKSKRAELTVLRVELASAQQAQTRILQTWLADWYGTQPSRQDRAGEHMSREYKTFLARARSAAGPEFEEAFLRGMRLHHRQGLAESKLCQQRASRTELKDFCGELTSEQQRDMQRIGKFICERYRDCLGVDEARH